mgnify:CR=1 FL=1
MASRTILILDDEPALAGLYAAALEGAGHDVVVCTGFEEARAHLKHDVPAGLVTDVRVGEYNGLQLALLFRTVSPAGAIMVVSGPDDAVIRREAAQMGASFRLKPIQMSELTRFFGGTTNAAS